MNENLNIIDGLYIPQIYLLKNEDTIMKINKMIIDNICGIKHIEINFNKRLNLICGENGVGKTTILKAIAHQFIYGNDGFIKKYYNSEKGIVNMLFDNDNKYITYEVKDFKPDYVERYFRDAKRSDKLLLFSSSRSINYQKINALPPIEKKKSNELNDHHSSDLLILGVDKNIKSWFINRLIFSNVDNSLNKFQKNNLKLSKKVFELLDENLYVKTARPDLEIVLTQNNNEIFFEMLSDGYKSCIFILLGIIKEMEYRYPEKNAVEFDGIIMIDEIDIHLHPQWQAKLVKILTEIFPNAQIIATTHSPSVLQNAKAEEIIPLYKDLDGNVYIKNLELGEYGLQGWTLEEILQDIMGMPSTTSKLYLKIVKKFDTAMENEDREAILENYEILKKMLHPKNPMLQLLEIQVAEWKD